MSQFNIHKTDETGTHLNKYALMVKVCLHCKKVLQKCSVFFYRFARYNVKKKVILLLTNLCIFFKWVEKSYKTL